MHHPLNNIGECHGGRINDDRAIGRQQRLPLLRVHSVAPAEVLRDLNRHLSGRVLRATAQTEHLPVTGVFRLDDIEGSLEALEVALPVRRIRRGETIVFVPEGLAR